jgi:hypothetical protein
MRCTYIVTGDSACSGCSDRGPMSLGSGLGGIKCSHVSEGHNRQTTGVFRPIVSA